VAKRRAKDATDSQIFADELGLMQSRKPDEWPGCVLLLRLWPPFATVLAMATTSAIENYLNSRLAYALGDERECHLTQLS